MLERTTSHENLASYSFFYYMFHRRCSSDMFEVHHNEVRSSLFEKQCNRGEYYFLCLLYELGLTL